MMSNQLAVIYVDDKDWVKDHTSFCYTFLDDEPLLDQPQQSSN